MPYFQRTKDGVKQNKAAALGVRLAKLAVKREYSVVQIASYTKASRATIYSWFAGRGVSNAYKPIVNKLIDELKQR